MFSHDILRSDNGKRIVAVVRVDIALKGDKDATIVIRGFVPAAGSPDAIIAGMRMKANGSIRGTASLADGSIDGISMIALAQDVGTVVADGIKFMQGIAQGGK